MWKKDASVDPSYREYHIGDSTPLPDVDSARHFRIQLKLQPEVSRQPIVWVLLTRHVTDTHRQEDYISLSVQNEDDNVFVASMKARITSAMLILTLTFSRASIPTIDTSRRRQSIQAPHHRYPSSRPTMDRMTILASRSLPTLVRRLFGRKVRIDYSIGRQ